MAVLGKPDTVEDKGQAIGTDEHSSVNHFRVPHDIKIDIMREPDRAAIAGAGHPLMGPAVFRIDVMFPPGLASSFTQALALMGLRLTNFHVKTGPDGAAETDYFLDGGQYYGIVSAAWHAKWNLHNAKRNSDLLTFEWVAGAAVSKSASQAGANTPQPSHGAGASVSSSGATGYKIISDRDAELSDAISATDIAATRDKEGQVIRFTDVVTGVRLNADHSATQIEFASTGHHAILAYILKPNLSGFPTLGKLLGKVVLIRGEIHTAGGQPKVEVTEPGQIKIISADASP